MTPDAARTVVRGSASVIGALALHRGEVDALICGLEGRFASRLDHIRDIVGLAPGAQDFSALSVVIASSGVFFLADTHVRYEPSAEEIAETAIACAHHVRRFGVDPKIALISHSDFGSADTPSARKMREALRILQERAPDLEVDGEMQADAALSLVARERVIANSLFGARPTCSSSPISTPGARRCNSPGSSPARSGGPDSHRPGEARACLDPLSDRARHRQHDGDRRRRGGRRVAVHFTAPRVVHRGQNLN